MPAVYDEELNEFYTGVNLVDADCVGWWPLPEKED